ncbi:hypothetical protein J4416_01835 [Candidatus Pacearchaeota archaeon]|nr:hypothetical protein [Candidatus Pacearchaeota archaeon]
MDINHRIGSLTAVLDTHKERKLYVSEETSRGTTPWTYIGDIKNVDLNVLSCAKPLEFDRHKYFAGFEIRYENPEGIGAVIGSVLGRYLKDITNDAPEVVINPSSKFFRGSNSLDGISSGAVFNPRAKDYPHLVQRDRLSLDEETVMLNALYESLWKSGFDFGQELD